MSKKEPKYIIVKLFPFGFANAHKLNEHFTTAQLIELINKNEKPIYLNHKFKRDLLSVREGKLFVGEKIFDVENVNKLSSQKKSAVIFGRYPFGYINLLQPSIHYDEKEIVEYILTNQNKKYYLDDRNTRLTIDKNGKISVQQRLIRKWVIIVGFGSLCLAVPAGSIYGIVTLIKNSTGGHGIIPTRFNTGMSVDNWMHYEAKKFISRHTNNITFNSLDDGTLMDSSMLSSLNYEDLYTMVLASMLYAPLFTAPSDGTSTQSVTAPTLAYLPWQWNWAPIDSEGTPGYHNNYTEVTPIMSIYAKDIYFNFIRDPAFSTNGQYTVHLSYFLPTTVMGTNIVGYNVSYDGTFSLLLGGNEKTWQNLDRTNQKLYNTQNVPINNGGYPTLHMVGVNADQTVVESGDTGYVTDTVFDSNNTSMPSSDVKFNDKPGDNSYGAALSPKSQVQNLYNTDPNQANNILWTANVFMKWTINGSK